MADIELIIKIPEKECKNICLMSKDGIGMALYDWVANGTPLPKGHGDLVDRDAVYKAYDYSDIEYTMMNALEDAPTIIEADHEVEEGKT